MGRYFLLALRGHLRGGRTLFALTVAGVALGVASVLCIQILNRNAIGAFAGSVEAVTGDADLAVLSRSASLDEGIFPAVLGARGVESAWPLLRQDVALESPTRPGAEPIFLELIGVDFFAPVRFPISGRGSSAAEGLSLREAVTTPGWTALTPEFVRDLGLELGDSLVVSSGSTRIRLQVGALVDFRKLTPTATRRLAVMDIAEAQRLLGRLGRIDEIDLRVVPGTAVREVREELGLRLGPNVEVATPEQREAEAAGLLRAFRVNLTALSLISLFVGVFLVYSSLQAALLRRRGELGLLRSLGATSGQVLAILWAEVGVIALLGVALGLPLGLWAARANVSTVSGTLSNLYLLEAIETLELPWPLWLLAIGIGLAGAAAGAFLPATDLARRDVRALLVAHPAQAQSHLPSRRMAAAAGLLLAASVALFLSVGRGTRLGGFVLALGWIACLPLVVPSVLQRASRLLPTRRLDLAHALRSLGGRAATTAPAVASLGLAVSMLVGVTLLTGSFRQTVIAWIESSVRADIFITTRNWARSRGEAILERSVEQALLQTPGVRAVDRLRQTSVTRVGGGRVRVSGVDMRLPGGEARFPLLEGSMDEALPRLREQGWIVLGEPLARKADLHPGDSLRVIGPRGPISLPIAAVCYDYTTEAGSIAMDLGTFAAHFGDGPIQNLALYLEPGVPVEETVDLLKARFSGQPLLIRSNRTLRNEILRIFDQTFAVTRLLQAMSLLIAAAGVALTLLILARERASELSLYRAVGADRGQIFRLFLGEGLGIGGLGLLLGLIGGTGLAFVLVYVINRDWFGWTIRFAWIGRDLALQALTILLVSGAAAIDPAYRASKVSAAALAREDV